MKDPRNEREAYPHLQRQADLKYRREEMRQVRPSYVPGSERKYLLAVLVFLALALGVVGTIWYFIFRSM